MNDHHFSYPRVVPLRGTTISGHATQPATPIASLPRQSADQAGAAKPALKPTSLAA